LRCRPSWRLSAFSAVSRSFAAKPDSSGNCRFVPYHKDMRRLLCSATFRLLVVYGALSIDMPYSRLAVNRSMTLFRKVVQIELELAVPGGLRPSFGAPRVPQSRRLCSPLQSRICPNTHGTVK